MAVEYISVEPQELENTTVSEPDKTLQIKTATRGSFVKAKTVQVDTVKTGSVIVCTESIEAKKVGTGAVLIAPEVKIGTINEDGLVAGSTVDLQQQANAAATIIADTLYGRDFTNTVAIISPDKDLYTQHDNYYSSLEEFLGDATQKEIRPNVFEKIESYHDEISTVTNSSQ